MHPVQTGQCPAYFAEAFKSVTASDNRSGLPSADRTAYAKSRKRTILGERALSSAKSAAWNDLPDSIREIRNTF